MPHPRGQPTRWRDAGAGWRSWVGRCVLPAWWSLQETRARAPRACAMFPAWPGDCQGCWCIMMFVLRPAPQSCLQHQVLCVPCFCSCPAVVRAPSAGASLSALMSVTHDREGYALAAGNARLAATQPGACRTAYSAQHTAACMGLASIQVVSCCAGTGLSLGLAAAGSRVVHAPYCRSLQALVSSSAAHKTSL